MADETNKNRSENKGGGTQKDANRTPKAGAPGTDPGQPIEVPGRPDADRQKDRDKAYGPGGGRPQMDGGQQPGAQSSDEDEPNAEPNRGAGGQQGGRTGAGSDTRPI